MRPEFAFYYPGQYWSDPDWIKNLVCFFDGVAMLVPEYMPDVQSFDDYPLAASLKERGLLRIIRPEQVVDSAATKKNLLTPCRESLTLERWSLCSRMPIVALALDPCRCLDLVSTETKR